MTKPFATLDEQNLAPVGIGGLSRLSSIPSGAALSIYSMVMK